MQIKNYYAQCPSINPFLMLNHQTSLEQIKENGFRGLTDTSILSLILKWLLPLWKRVPFILSFQCLRIQFPLPCSYFKAYQVSHLSGLLCKNAWCALVPNACRHLFFFPTFSKKTISQLLNSFQTYIFRVRFTVWTNWFFGTTKITAFLEWR